MGKLWIHGIAFDFLRCWGVFGSLSHFRRSSGAVPPWALCRWAHVWRNEPQAIILSFHQSPAPLCCSVYLCLSLHRLYLSLCTPFSVFTPSRLLISPLFHPPVATASWGLGLGGRPQQNKLTEMQGRISGLCYRKICPLALCRAARRTNGGCVMERHGAIAFVLVEPFIPVAEHTCILPGYQCTQCPSLSKFKKDSHGLPLLNLLSEPMVWFSNNC